MKVLELRIPPALVFAIAAILMKLATRVMPAWQLIVPGRVVLAVAVAVAGGLLGLAGIVAFHRAKTTVHPMRPSEASSLVTTGIYTTTRNPMYLGLLIWLIALGLYIGHPLSLLAIPAFFLYMNRFQIIPEERALAAAFGADFEAYRARVRRWL